MRKMDPTGRMDLLAIRLLEWYVDHKAGVAEAAVYRQYKRQIDSSIRRYLGSMRLSREQLEALAKAAVTEAAKRREEGRAA